MTTESTVAKIGRSIKNREIMQDRFTSFRVLPGLRMRSPGLRAVGRAAGGCSRRCICSASDGIGPLLRLDFHLGADLLDRAHHDPIVRLDFPLDHAEAVFLQGPVLMRRVLDLVLRVEDVNVLQSLIGLDGPIDDQQRFVRLADRQPDAHEHAGRKQPAEQTARRRGWLERACRRGRSLPSRAPGPVGRRAGSGSLRRSADSLRRRPAARRTLRLVAEAAWGWRTRPAA